jgi:putative exporter of polyketide antibiotics
LVPEHAGIDEAWMLEGFLRTLVKVAVASLIVGTILAHFGITIDVLIKETGFSTEHVQDLVRRGLAWAMPNLLLGALIIVPVWFLAFLFRPPGQSSE